MAESSRSQWVLIILSAAAIPVAVVVGLTAQRRAAKHSPPAMPQLPPQRRLRERCFAQWDDAVWVEEEVEESELLMTAASGIAWERAVFGSLVAGESVASQAEREPHLDRGPSSPPAHPVESALLKNEPWREETATTLPRRAFVTATLLTFALFLIAILGFAWFGPSSEPSAHPAATLTAQQQQWNYRNIEDYRPGMWAMARNPEMQGAELEELDRFDPEFDRLIRFELHKSDGSLLEFCLVRDLDWIKDNVAEVGREVDTELEELGVSGPATVMSIEVAPTTTGRRHPDQRLVTGTFKHRVPVTVILKIAEQASGQISELECTPNHPFWCPERLSFVRADELHPGQALVSALLGHYRLVSITPHVVPTTVYNIEVDGQHVYYASGFATLVHNGCPSPNGKKGGQAHQDKIDAVEVDIKNRGLKPERELRVATVNGTKDHRYMDIVARDPSTNQIHEVHQVGRGLKSDPTIPVARERAALRDVELSQELFGALRKFHNYLE